MQSTVSTEATVCLLGFVCIRNIRYCVSLKWVSKCVSSSPDIPSLSNGYLLIDSSRAEGFYCRIATGRSKRIPFLCHLLRKHLGQHKDWHLPPTLLYNAPQSFFYQFFVVGWKPVDPHARAGQSGIGIKIKYLIGRVTQGIFKYLSSWQDYLIESSCTE